MAKKHAQYHDLDLAGLCCPPYEVGIRSDRLYTAVERERAGGNGKLQQNDSAAPQQYRRAYALLRERQAAAGHHGMLGVPVTAVIDPRVVPAGTPAVFGYSPPTTYSNALMLGNASRGGANLAWLMVVNGVGSTQYDRSALQHTYPAGCWTDDDVGGWVILHRRAFGPQAVFNGRKVNKLERMEAYGPYRVLELQEKGHIRVELRRDWSNQKTNIFTLQDVRWFYNRRP